LYRNWNKKECLNAENAKKYIERQKNWFSERQQAIQSIEGNKYKILVKCLQVPVLQKKTKNKEKLNSLRIELISKLWLASNDAILSMGNSQVLGKLNGILFSNDTLKTKGKEYLIKLACKFCEKGIMMLPNQDQFSLHIMRNFIQKECTAEIKYQTNSYSKTDKVDEDFYERNKMNDLKSRISV
jgi:hypothetical protein